MVGVEILVVVDDVEKNATAIGVPAIGLLEVAPAPHSRQIVVVEHWPYCYYMKLVVEGNNSVLDSVIIFYYHFYPPLLVVVVVVV